MNRCSTCTHTLFEGSHYFIVFPKVSLIVTELKEMKSPENATVGVKTNFFVSMLKHKTGSNLKILVMLLT